MAGELGYTSHAFCHFCGTKRESSQTGSLEMQCLSCEQFTYQNSIPVGNLIIPHSGGIYLVQRGIEPGRGKWGLPGGYLMRGESWREGCAREAWEEIQIRVNNPNGSIDSHMVESTPGGTQIVLYGLMRSDAQAEIHTFQASEEALGRRILMPSDWADFRQHIAFALHVRAIDQYFASL